MTALCRFNLKPFLCGNSGAQWMGWFREEIHSIDDFQGLRFARPAGTVAPCRRSVLRWSP